MFMLQQDQLSDVHFPSSSVDSQLTYPFYLCIVCITVKYTYHQVKPSGYRLLHVMCMYTYVPLLRSMTRKPICVSVVQMCK